MVIYLKGMKEENSGAFTCINKLKEEEEER